ncbi:isocitrate dehydrogenase [Desulfocarbo indianensis]|nr:isocitrate dehydrogenase [Desulfocarbo indianensis]
MTMAAKIAVIPGDGIGSEVTEACLQVLEASGVALEFQNYHAGDYCLERFGRALPEETLAGALEAQAVLFGAAGASAAEVILRLRAELGTYVNLRPAKAFRGVECLYPSCDIMIVRENTECLYAGIESRLTADVATATRLITRGASRRIALSAFEYARQNGRKKVTAVHKVNVLRKTDALFLECCREVAKDYPQVAYEEGLVDSVAMRLVMDPSAYDVIVTTNLFGDILSDLAAGLIGGLGLCPSANLGDEHALFEPVHGSAPDIAGQGLANPSASIMCGAMLLRHLGHTAQAEKIEKALAAAIAAKEATPDLGGGLKTMQMAQAVIARM